MDGVSSLTSDTTEKPSDSAAKQVQMCGEFARHCMYVGTLPGLRAFVIVFAAVSASHTREPCARGLEVCVES